MMRRAKNKLIFQYDNTVNFFADALTRMRAHEGFKRYFKNTGWLFTGQFTNMIIAFFVGTYIARYLGPEQYGLLSYTVSFVGLFAFIAGLGIDNVLSRELVVYPQKRDALLGTAFFLKVAGGVAAILGIIVTTILTSSNHQADFLAVLFATTFIFQAVGVIDYYFQSKVLAKKTVTARIVAMFVSAAVKLLFIYLGLGVTWFIFAYVIDAFVLAVGFALMYGRIGEWTFDRALAKTILRDSWPLMFASVAVAIYSRIDQVMLKYFIGNGAVGLYSSAVKIAEIGYFIPTLICASIYPALINAKKTSGELYKKRALKLYGMMIALAILFSAPIVFFAKGILIMLFGKAYIGGAAVLQIYTWANVPVFLGVAVSQYLVIENLNKAVLFMTIGGAVINIILNIILIPQLGIEGAAIATTASQCLVVLLGLSRASLKKNQ